MPSPSAPPTPTPTLRTASDVLPRLPHRHHCSAAGLGRCVPARALPAHVLLQLLVGLRVGNHRSFLEPRQLPRATGQARLLADVAAFHVDRHPRDVFFHAARLSAGLLPLVPRRRQKGSLLSARSEEHTSELQSPMY